MCIISKNDEWSNEKNCRLNESAQNEKRKKNSRKAILQPKLVGQIKEKVFIDTNTLVNAIPFHLGHISRTFIVAMGT